MGKSSGMGDRRARQPLADLVEESRRKHLGMDDYWLAQAFARVRQVVILPRMVRSIALEELRAFFLAEAGRLMRGSSGS